MTLGHQRLKQIMAEQGINQAKVAERVKVGADVVSRWLEEDPGKRQTKPSLEVAARLHKAFGIDLLDWSKEAPPDSGHGTSEPPDGERGVA